MTGKHSSKMGRILAKETKWLEISHDTFECVHSLYMSIQLFWQVRNLFSKMYSDIMKCPIQCLQRIVLVYVYQNFLFKNFPTLSCIYMYIKYFNQKVGWNPHQLYMLNSWTRAIINYSARVRLFGRLFGILSFMLHAKQSSGNCQK